MFDIFNKNIIKVVLINLPLFDNKENPVRHNNCDVKHVKLSSPVQSCQKPLVSDRILHVTYKANVFSFQTECNSFSFKLN